MITVAEATKVPRFARDDSALWMTGLFEELKFLSYQLPINS